MIHPNRGGLRWKKCIEWTVWRPSMGATDELQPTGGWRAAKFGRAPAQSTLKTHNAALQRVFDEAVIRKWMTQSKVPSLSSASGATAKRRDYFTTAEIDKIRDAFPGWINDSRKEVTRQIRQLLFFYFNVALHTGLRPGTEMDN